MEMMNDFQLKKLILFFLGFIVMNYLFVMIVWTTKGISLFKN